MSSSDVNRAVFEAVLQIFEAWIDGERGAAAHINGIISDAERDDRIRRATAREADANDVLELLLPEQALASVAAGVRNLTPSRRTQVGNTLHRLGPLEQRQVTANRLLVAAAEAQRLADRRKAAAREAAEVEARRVASEAARALAEADAERVRLAARLAAFDRLHRDALGVFETDFLGADAWFDARLDNGDATLEDFAFWKAEFVRAWARRVLGDDRLDPDQAATVATTSNDQRIVARAGSGKTRTLVTRALFLQLHCGVDPGAILLAAFNRKAVGEIGQRLSDALPPDAPRPHVVTFHALAYALLKPDEEIVLDDEDAETWAQSRRVQDVIDQLRTERPRDVRRAMMGHFQDSWEALKRRGLDLDRETFFGDPGVLTRVTYGGEYVRSMGERLIANTLFTHGVDYKYERNFTRAGFNMRPDFTILESGKPRVVIEYFGITGNQRYLDEAAKKRHFWARQHDLTFIELIPEDIVGTLPTEFADRITAKLREAGVPLRSLTEDEIWNRISTRAVDTFSKAVTRFIGRARQLHMTEHDIRRRLNELEATDGGAGVAHFVELAADALAAYVSDAERFGFDDFSGIMWRAADAVRNDATRWTRAGGREHGDLRLLRFLHVDEFQDFSTMFMELVKAIRSQCPAARLCVVGDDWQAINGFAGADLRFFDGFENDVAGSTSTALGTNYRSGVRIVGAGNAVMHGRGRPAVAHTQEPGEVQVARLASFTPSVAEREAFAGDVGTPALLRLVQDGLDRADQVAVLFRRNSPPWYTKSVRGTFGRTLESYQLHVTGRLSADEAARVEFTTAHKYKGREADHVIVAGADLRSYPLIHPTAELFEIFGDTLASLVDAERRLFYVATTRAASTLCYLVGAEDSPFLEPATRLAREVPWSALPSRVAGPAGRVLLRVHDGYHVREQLKDPYGFDYDSSTRTWFVLRPERGFDFGVVQHRLAFVGPRLIEVLDAEGRLIHQAGARLTSPF